MKIPVNISNTSSLPDSFKTQFLADSEKNTSSAPGRLIVVSNTASPTAERLNFYTRLVNQENTTEDVVSIGGMIQRDITQQNNHETLQAYSPSNHSGNWKSSFIQNFIQLFSTIFQNPVSGRSGNQTSGNSTVIFPPSGHHEHTLNNISGLSEIQNRKMTDSNDVSDIKLTERKQPDDVDMVNSLLRENVTESYLPEHARVRRAGGDDEAGSSLSGKKRPGDAAEGAPSAKFAKLKGTFSPDRTRSWSTANRQILTAEFPAFLGQD
ncbi:LifA-like protein [Citrobacter freundii]|nr:LifA-like protein [Citrobacter freundii]